MATATDYIVGIDLGTTTSCVAIMEVGRTLFQFFCRVLRLVLLKTLRVLVPLLRLLPSLKTVIVWWAVSYTHLSGCKCL